MAQFFIELVFAEEFNDTHSSSGQERGFEKRTHQCLQ